MFSRRDFLKLTSVTTASLSVAGCRGLDVSPPDEQGNSPASTSSLKEKINHIVFTMQENRSFDHYFGKLPQYRASKGYPGTVDGLPADASNPAADDPSQKVLPYHLSTECHENLSPYWNEAHLQFNRNAPNTDTQLMDGFVLAAANYSRQTDPAEGPFYDMEGKRAMGYYDQTDLPYYYELFSQFAISDRYFASVPTNTLTNRMYLLAATSQGRVSPTFPTPEQLKVDTIFDLCEKAGVTWKIYCNGPDTYYQWFTGYNTKQSKVVDAEEFIKDCANGTLPQVSMIESGTASGLDEHPRNNVQEGSAYMKRFFDALMASSLWQKSIMMLTYDEGGGFYDHVPPPNMPAPDDIPPQLQSNDFAGNFQRLGTRVPFVVVSPWVKKHYVSHTPIDHTAIMRLIQKRFDLPTLSKRDAASHDLLDMFNFASMSFATPPALPAQPVTGVCNNQLVA